VIAGQGMEDHDLKRRHGLMMAPSGARRTVAGHRIQMGPSAKYGGVTAGCETDSPLSGAGPPTIHHP
jgi:hypothetical protein